MQSFFIKEAISIIFAAIYVPLFICIVKYNKHLEFDLISDFLRNLKV